MDDKKGFILGSIMMLVVSTIAIVLILLIFIIGASIIKVVKNPDEIVVYNESDVGIGDVGNYIEGDYRVFCDVRARIGRGIGFEEAIGGAGYEG